MWRLLLAFACTQPWPGFEQRAGSSLLSHTPEGREAAKSFTRLYLLRLLNSSAVSVNRRSHRSGDGSTSDSWHQRSLGSILLLGQAEGTQPFGGMNWEAEESPGRSVAGEEPGP